LPTERIKLVRYRPKQSWVSPDWILSWVAFGCSIPSTRWNEFLFFGASLWPAISLSRIRTILNNVSKGAVMSAGGDESQLINRSWYEVLGLIRHRLPTGDDVQFASLDQVQPDPIRNAATESLKELDANYLRYTLIINELGRASSIVRRAAACGEISVFWQPRHIRLADPTLAWLYGKPQPSLRIPPAKFDTPLVFGRDELWASGDGGFGLTAVARGIVLDGAEVLDRWPNPDPDRVWSQQGDEVQPQPEEKRAGQEGSVTRNRGGRPARHDWNAFWQEAAVYAGLNGLEEENRLELQRHLEGWTADRWLEPPDAATIRKKLSEFYAKVAGRI
jgi:hypothetical protein